MTVKFKFIDAQKADFSNREDVRVDQGVQVGYYEWRDRPCCVISSVRGGVRIRDVITNSPISPSDLQASAKSDDR